MAEIPLPFKYLLKSSLIPIAGGGALADKRIQRIMPGLNCLTLTCTGAALLFLFLIRLFVPGTEPRRTYFASYKHSQLYYGVIRLIPGGAAVLNGHTFRASAILTILFAMLMPIIKWPSDTQNYLNVLREIQFYYIYFVWFVVAAFCYVGFHAYDGQEE